LRDVLLLVAGAAIAGLIGLGFTILQAKRDSEIRRRELTKMLATELAFIDAATPVYEIGKVIYRDPIRVQALDLLLDGRTMSFKRQLDLLNGLIRLRGLLARYNDFINVTNIVQAGPAMPDSAHRQIYDTVVHHHREIITCRDDLMRLLED
jgi:hypothetical protein